MELNIIIKTIRTELGISQEALARELHVGFTSVNRWENSKSKPNQIARHSLVELCKNKSIDPELITMLENTK